MIECLIRDQSVRCWFYKQFVDVKIPRGPYLFQIFVAPTKQILMESGNWIPNIISARHEIQFVQIVNQKHQCTEKNVHRALQAKVEIFCC